MGILCMYVSMGKDMTKVSTTAAVICVEQMSGGT